VIEEAGRGFGLVAAGESRMTAAEAHAEGEGLIPAEVIPDPEGEPGTHDWCNLSPMSS
jgi:hypothetical protein